MDRFDENKDGLLTERELPEFIWNRLSRADKNSDGKVSADEIESAMRVTRPDGTSASERDRPREADRKPEGDRPRDRERPSDNPPRRGDDEREKSA